MHLHYYVCVTKYSHLTRCTEMTNDSLRLHMYIIIVLELKINFEFKKGVEIAI